MTGPEQPGKALRVSGAVAISLFIALAIAYAARRAPWNDEGWFANASLNLARQGFMGSTVIEPTGTHLPAPPYGIQRYTYWVLPVYLVTQAVWYKIGGFSLLWMRMSSVLFGAVGLLAFWFAASRFTASRQIGCIATILLALDTFYMNVSSLARMDIMAVSLGWIALAAFLGLRESNFTAAIAVSYTSLALACFTHHQAALAAIALVVTTIYFDRHRLRFQHLLIAAVPFAMLASAWGLYAAQRPDYFWAQLRANGSGRLSMLANPLEALKAEIVRRYGVVYGFEAGANSARKLLVIVPLSYLLAIVVGLWSPFMRKHNRFLLVSGITGLMALYQYLFEGMKLSLYLIHLVPWFTLLLAIVIVQMWRCRVPSRAALAVFLALWVAIQVSASILVIAKNDYPRTFAPVKSILERENHAGVLINGSPELGLEIGFDHLVDDLRMGYYSHKRPTMIALDARYRDWMGRFFRNEPDVYRYIEHLLSQYDKIYDAGGYEIYVAPPSQVQSRHSMGKRFRLTGHPSEIVD